MGDGGVACMPQLIMERFSISETVCGGTGGLNSKSQKFTDLEKKQGKKNMKVKKQELKVKRVKKGESKSELTSERGNTGGEVENGESHAEKLPKEDVEEGELGTLKWPRGDSENGEFTPDKSRKGDIEKGKLVSDKWRKREVEKGEFVSGNWRRGNEEKEESFSRKSSQNGEFSKVEKFSDNNRRPEPDKLEFRAWRESKDELERGEFIPERWEKGEVLKGEYGYGKTRRRFDLSNKDRAWKCEREYDRTPPSVRYTSEDSSQRKEYSRSAGQLSKRSFRRETSQDRNSRIGSKVVDEEGDTKHGYSNGKSHDRDYSYPSRLKRNGTDLESNERRHYGEYGDSIGSKSRRLSDEVNRASYSDHYSRHSVERAYRNSSSQRYSSGSRHHEALSSRVIYERHGRSPSHTERSPRDRARYQDHRARSPLRHYDYRTRSPTQAERSPPERPRHYDRRDRTPTYLERSPLDRIKPSNSYRETSRKNGGTEKSQNQSGNITPEGKLNQRDTEGRETQLSGKEPLDRSAERNLSPASPEEEKCQSPKVDYKEPPQDDGVGEELPSMEEDMDICDTPPHVPVVADSSFTGKWFYLDHSGVEQGPSKLGDLKELMNEGALELDHFVKHLDSDRWVTLENAVSPMVTLNFQSIVSDSVTQLASPPEAPGNVLADTGDKLVDCGYTESEPPEDLAIDERVGALLRGFAVVPGRELETLGEILQTTFEWLDWERLTNIVGFSCKNDQSTEDGSVCSEVTSKEGGLEKENVFICNDFSNWFASRWSCKGGDWKRTDETILDKFSRKKLVLNDGYPLCQMEKSGNEDPRWHRKDELYYPSQSRRLNLPTWAFSCPDESQIKPVIGRGVKGTMMPVVRINACVVKDHGSIVSEPRFKTRQKDRYSSRSSSRSSSRPYPDYKRDSVEGSSSSSSRTEQNLISINTPKDRISTKDDLQVNLGDWYFLDGAGHEIGPSSFSELQVLVDQGIIQKGTSVFRKFDKVWVPATSASSSKNPRETVSGSIHSMHPQFIGYTRGKLHELVMKSYKSREFAAAINEVLDPWISSRQPKKEIQQHMFAYAKSEGDEYTRACKRSRVMIDGSDEDYESGDDISAVLNDDISFEDTCGDATFDEEHIEQTGTGSWSLLDGHVLARIFHFLRGDVKSLSLASSTCRQWRCAIRFYKDISKQVDFSSVGRDCSDSIFSNIMKGYNKEKIASIVLSGCTNISPTMLEEMLSSLPCISSIDIRGCTQFSDLTMKFPNLNWIKTKSRCRTKILSLTQITEKTSSFSKSYKGLGSSHIDDSNDLKEYFNRDSASRSFRRSIYKRSKLVDAKRSASILSRESQLRRLAMKKSENGYKRVMEFLSLSLKDIMKENTCDYFVPKVAEIEDRMTNGYYVGHGLSSVKEDISRMCRDAIKVQTRGDAGDMKRIITMFIKLVTRLEENSSREKEEMIKAWKYDAAPSRYKKNQNRSLRGGKHKRRSNGSSFYNNGSDSSEYSSDREIRRRLSKLNKKSIGSESETSDDVDRSSEDGRSDNESTVSETESELDFRSEGGIGDSRGNRILMEEDEEGLEYLTDEREWGARMTKASLVPPITRKYEVIEKYVIVADEEEVTRKMRVSLPDDYAEKLSAQKSGTEESDMELPEVKDYKPRKELGHEVLEQEVYGIDPYTHNLLLDSMPDESDWPLLEKHFFIEDVLLRTLNKQVRQFTGTGNTPMKYPLQPVVEEILKMAEDNHDTRMMRLCQDIKKAMGNRPDDNYVAYRKGLGVVCNKAGGFSEDDFVVEFLGEVYPAWKWFEKQDGIRSLQKNNKDPAPEFYNIYLERPKGDAEGYDLVVVDAMHKANYASRICHSCRPNCEAKVTAVDGQYQIGIYSVRPISYGEEITFDYNSVTESKEEYEASVCLCGSQICRGSYLNLTGEGAFQKVLKECHGILNRHQLMLEACELNSVSKEDYIDLGRAGLGSCLLGGLPDWLIAYSARLVRFINYERTMLPEEILRHNLEEKRKYFADICLEVEKNDAEVQAEGVYNQRLQNLALTLDKVRYVMRCVFGDPKKAPPPLEKLSPIEAVSLLWKGEGSLVEELLECICPHVDGSILSELKLKIHAHDPSNSKDIEKELHKSLLWLRDEVRDLPCTYKCRHDAAADLIHIYAYTKFFFRVREFKSVTSPPVYISPLDLGPKYGDKFSGLKEYHKTYGENYCLGQLIYWHSQNNADPDCSVVRASRGCLSLPDIASFYAKVQKPSRQRVYGPSTLRFMLSRMEKQPQRAWPKDRIWLFKTSPKIFGSPMMDSILNNSPLDREMLHWLKNRPAIFQAMWDR